MTSFVLLLLATSAGAAAQLQAPAVGHGCARHLDDMVDTAILRGPSVVAALVDFGRDNGVCFGVESPGKGLLNRPVDLKFGPSSVRSILAKILPPRYAISEQHSVIQIRNRAAGPARQLNVVIPQLTIQADPKTNLTFASFMIYSLLQELVVPSTGGGMVGSVLSLPADEAVSPVNESNKRVRELLNVIISHSNGASWMSDNCDLFRLRPGEACWTIAQYSRRKVSVERTVRDYVQKRLERLETTHLSKQ